MEELSLIDVSLEDDILISPGDQCLLDPLSPIGRAEEPISLLSDPPSPIGRAEDTLHLRECIGDLHSGESNIEEEALTKSCNLNNEIPELSVSPESKRSNPSSNFRKSLAWDSAFFTCEGVLNTEELASINSTFQKNEKTVLAGIPEEMRRSAESSTTIDSDSWTLESLETELFDNVRASIQKSLGGVSNKDSKVIKNKKEGLGASRLGSKEKIMRASQNKIKPPTATGIRRAGLPPKLPQKTLKSAPITSKLSIGVTNVEPKAASLKPPRILPKSTNVSKTLIKGPAPPLNTLKRNSTGSVLNAPPAPKVSKIPSNSTSRSLIGPSLKRTQPFSDPKLKSLIPVSKKKSIPTPNKSITPSSSKGKTGTLNKLIKQSSISPNSSIDSADLNSSASSLSPSLLKSIRSPGSLTGQSLSKDPVSVSGGLSRSSSNSSICSEERGFKPSGLRLPTPKIGYFDKEKALGRNTVEKENVNLNTSEGVLVPVPVVQHLEERISSLSLSQM